jgi:hypothetical protein
MILPHTVGGVCDQKPGRVAPVSACQAGSSSLHGVEAPCARTPPTHVCNSQVATHRWREGLPRVCLAAVLGCRCVLRHQPCRPVVALLKKQAPATMLWYHAYGCPVSSQGAGSACPGSSWQWRLCMRPPVCHDVTSSRVVWRPPAFHRMPQQGPTCAGTPSEQCVR